MTNNRLRIKVNGSWSDITYEHLSTLSAAEFQKIEAIEETKAITPEDFKKFKHLLKNSTKTHDKQI